MISYTGASRVIQRGRGTFIDRQDQRVYTVAAILSKIIINVSAIRCVRGTPPSVRVTPRDCFRIGKIFLHANIGGESVGAKRGAICDQNGHGCIVGER
ncbi:MAG: hypothetical protein LBV74_20815 [Tannerella sp.]|nr:hypothetical protein [Tannerella sp.]